MAPEQAEKSLVYLRPGLEAVAALPDRLELGDRLRHFSGVDVEIGPRGEVVEIVGSERDSLFDGGESLVGLV